MVLSVPCHMPETLVAAYHPTIDQKTKSIPSLSRGGYHFCLLASVCNGLFDNYTLLTIKNQT